MELCLWDAELILKGHGKCFFLYLLCVVIILSISLVCSGSPYSADSVSVRSSTKWGSPISTAVLCHGDWQVHTRPPPPHCIGSWNAGVETGPENGQRRDPEAAPGGRPNRVTACPKEPSGGAEGGWEEGGPRRAGPADQNKDSRGGYPQQNLPPSGQPGGDHPGAGDLPDGDRGSPRFSPHASSRGPYWRHTEAQPDTCRARRIRGQQKTSCPTEALHQTSLHPGSPPSSDSRTCSSSLLSCPVLSTPACCASH